MSWRGIGALAGLLHLAMLAPLAGGESFILDNVFRPDGEGIAAGLAPYGSVIEFEYPPLALPLIWGPAEITSTASGYREVFGWTMVLADLVIVALLAFGLRADRTRQIGALALYSAGLLPLALQNLATARFDLVPAALALAAVVARSEARSGTWGFAVGLGAAVKAYPLALIAVLARNEERIGRVALGIAAPLVLAGAVVLAVGGSFGSAIGYHTGRDLQIESVGATLLMLANELGADARVVFGSGSFNLVAPGDEVVRLVSSLAVLTGLTAVVWVVWSSRFAGGARRPVPSPAIAAAALVAALVVPAPVLSPQFLIWILPLSVLAFGLGRENLVLVAACALTWAVIEFGFPVQQELGAAFVWPLAARNALLVGYLALVMKRLHRETAVARRPGSERLRTTTPSS